jgi:hypothetical protein
MPGRNISVSQPSGTQLKGSSASKRRRQHHDDETDAPSQKRSRRTESEEPGEDETQIDDDEDLPVNTQVAAELEQKFEMENEARVRDRIERARKAQGVR